MLNQKKAPTKACYLFGKKISTAHIVGIGTPYASIIAQQLIKRGVKLTASENNLTSTNSRYWIKRGILYNTPHNADYITCDQDLIVIPNGPLPNNPEITKAVSLKLNIRPVQSVFGELTKSKRIIAIAGTHGKTTTTAMVIWLLSRCLHHKPGFCLGTAADKIKGISSNWYFSESSPYIIVEADEYKKQFLERVPSPYIVVITHIDLDHTDFYKSQKEYNDAFVDFCLQAKHTVIIEVTNENERYVYEKIKDNVHVSLLSKNDSETIPSGYLKLPGKHNSLNASKALKVCGFLKPSNQKLLGALKKFKGLAMRFEYKGKTIAGSKIFLDYAHNPKKLSACLASATEVKTADKNKPKVLLVFQPHSFERTSTFKAEFAASFTGADIVLITDIYAPAREPESYKKLITTEEFVKYLTHVNPTHNFIYTGNLSNTVTAINEIDNGKYIIVLASAGDLAKVIPDLKQHTVNKTLAKVA